MSIKIKDLYIEVSKQDFCSENHNESIFIGRIEVLRKLKRRLEVSEITKDNETNNYRGAYLIAGYRGMGKSTIAKKVILEINEQKRLDDYRDKLEELKIIPIKVFLSQGNLSDYDLIRQMFIQLESVLSKGLDNWWRRNINFVAAATSFLLLFVGSFFTYKCLKNLPETSIERHYFNLISEISVLHIAICLFLFLGLYYISKFIFLSKFNKKNRNKDDLIGKMIEVNRRVHSNLETDKDHSDNDFTNILGGSPLSFGFPKSIFTTENQISTSKQIYPQFTVKELEFELKEILRLYRIFRKNNKGYPQIVFVIDELDKLEPDFALENSDYLNLGKSRVESRKETIISLLANLKSLIHTSDAKYIFIGGAEMYEASLADVADRESFYSSIFNEVFYLNTFFKDYNNRQKRGMSEMVDYYLIRKILLGNNKPVENQQSNYNNYTTLFEALNYNSPNNSPVQRDFILYQLNRYLVYLTYRSNGSPKKLKALIEQNIVKITAGKSNKGENVHEDPHYLQINDKRSIIARFTDEKREKYTIIEKSQLSKDSKMIKGEFLHISYDLQYKAGLHASIYLPFLINTEHYLKKFNDKNLYLSAFLLDHVLKFHKSAFSWRELEFMPDIIIGSKGPSLRDMMNEIMSHLSLKHIRETTNAMFQYKFRSRTSQELRYISKISNESAAAFNFTYDESQHLKAFFKRKLKQKIEAYKDNKAITNPSFIHTIAYLNSVIADIHFYDEDYGAAIRYYSDSIQALRSIGKITNNHQKMLFTRDRLLLSLCLEKSKRYDSTYSIIRNTIIDMPTMEGKYEGWEDPYKRMQLFLRPHLSLLMVIEKDRSDGITSSNLKRNIKEYSDYMGLKDLFPNSPYNHKITFRSIMENSKKQGDYKRIQTLLADYYQSVGSILFFKNRNFLKLYESGSCGILQQHLKILYMTKKNKLVNIPFQKFEENPKNLPYRNLINVRAFFKVNHEHYFPGFSSFFYYSLSLGHLLMPYIENIGSIFNLPLRSNEGEEDIHLSNKMAILEIMAYNAKGMHILGGKQKELIALILSKLSDSILSCLGSGKEKENGLIIGKENPEFKTLLDDEIIDSEIEHCKIESFEELFNVLTVFYFNILSYRFYKLADKPYDALFVLKKCIYLITTHKSIYESSPAFVKELCAFLFKKSDDLIQDYSLTAQLSETSFFNSISQGAFSSKNLLQNEDEGELAILKKRCNLIIYKSSTTIKRFLLGSENKTNPAIDSIFLRIQQLKFHTELIYSRYKNQIDALVELKIKTITYISSDNTEYIAFNANIADNSLHNIPKKDFLRLAEEIIFCFKNLINISNTYGINYTLSNSYIASIYRHLIPWSKIFENLERFSWTAEFNNKENPHTDIKRIIDKKTSLFNSKNNKHKALEYYKKAISLHSEGAEYKRVIKDMYILEDDFNDGLTHFYASLERSLINTGRIKRRMENLYEN